MQPLYKRYENEEPAGVYSMGYAGYLFFEPKDDDALECDFVVCYEYPNGNNPRGYTRAEFRRHNVAYTNSYDNPRAFIWRDRRRVYLDDVLRNCTF